MIVLQEALRNLGATLWESFIWFYLENSPKCISWQKHSKRNTDFLKKWNIFFGGRKFYPTIGFKCYHCPTSWIELLLHLHSTNNVAFQWIVFAASFAAWLVWRLETISSSRSNGFCNSSVRQPRTLAVWMLILLDDESNHHKTSCVMDVTLCYC